MASYVVNPRNTMSLAQVEASMSRWDLDAYRIQRNNALATMQGTITDGNIPAKAVVRGRAPRDIGGFYILTGYFTLLKYLWGKTPQELDRVIGLGIDTTTGNDARLEITGADILVLREPISVNDFDLRGYSNTPDGISKSEIPAGQQFNPAYPPAAGIPQWRLFAPKKASFIVSVIGNQRINTGNFTPQDS